MDARASLLALPSLLVLGLLVVHSVKTMERRRALAFWGAVAVYGVLRGVALRWVIEEGLGASFPYLHASPLLPVFGVPLQEIAGWAIVAYLGWWLGARFSRHLFAQVAWACLFLGAISWAVESAAVAAGWWSWTVPVTHPWLVNVPFIALVDWAFVGIDFLLPFLALTSPALRGRPVRFLSLLAFPAHFAAHCFPLPLHQGAHWLLLGLMLWLALRSPVEDAPFGPRLPWLPPVGLAGILAVAGSVPLFLVDRPELLLSLLPVTVLAAHSLRPAAGTAAGAAALILGLWNPACVLGALPPAVAGMLGWGRRHRFAPAVLLATVAVLAAGVHVAGERGRAQLTRRLDEALAARDRGDLAEARRRLAALATDFPGSHVPWALLGEIEYRTERLPEAREAFTRAVAIKQDYVKGYRYLAVLERRLGGGGAAERGLAIAPSDPELLYLAGRSPEPLSPEAALALAALAFEVGDAHGAASVLDRALARWPERRALYPARLKLALHAGDEAAARRVRSAWRHHFSGDPPAP